MILNEIAAKTRARIAEKKKEVPLEALRERALALKTRPADFYGALAAPGLSFICEVKKASPSKGVLAEDFPYLPIAREYAAAGANALSVLTEPFYFLGADRYLAEIAPAVPVPVLRKDFTVDAYMLYEARLLGASAVLLICSLLDAATLAQYLHTARELGLAALVEAHDAGEIEQALAAGADIIGVNNRNLKNFSVDIGNSMALREKVPGNVLFVAESGIRTRADIQALEQNGVDAVLIGEALMKSGDKKAKLAELRGEAT